MWLKLKKQIRKWRSILVIAPCMVGLTIAANELALFQTLEWATLDKFFCLRPIEPKDKRIAVITIDESDIRKVGKWPIPDTDLAKLIENLQKQQPQAIGLNLYRDLPVEPGHQKLIQVFQSTPNLIGVEKFVEPSVSPPPTLSKLERVGIADLVLDADGKVRRGLLSVKTADDKVRLSVAAKLALMYLESKGISLQVVHPQKSDLRLGKAIFVPFMGNDGGYVRANYGGYQILLNYRGTIENFDTFTLTNVLENKIPSNILRDRIVFVGQISPSLSNRFLTPYSSSTSSSPKQMPGVVIQANLTSQILSAALDGRPLIRVLPQPIEVLWILVWSFMGATISGTLLKAFSRRHHIFLGCVLYGASGFLCIGLLIGSSYLAFLRGWWIPVFPPVAAFTGSAFALIGYRSRELQRLAEVDGLTQVANRSCFDQFLEREWNLTIRKTQYISLILCDVDHFKKYNDAYGHLQGDKCLQQVAQAIAAVTRRADFVARYGGEEFAVILSDTDPDMAFEIASRIRTNIESLHIPRESSLTSDRVTLSCGLVSIIPNSESSMMDFMASADRALYEAKKQGRNRIVTVTNIAELTG